jgi:hypothetical protein
LSEKILTVSNDGAVDLTIGQITAEAPFTVSVDTCSNTILVPHNSCSLTVRFAPASGFVYDSDLQVPYSDPDTGLYTAAVTLSGTGVVTTAPTPDISLDRTTLSFGSVNVGGTMTTAVTVNNTGNADLRIDGIAGRCFRFRVFAVKHLYDCPAAPGDVCNHGPVFAGFSRREERDRHHHLQ